MISHFCGVVLSETMMSLYFFILFQVIAAPVPGKRNLLTDQPRFSPVDFLSLGSDHHYHR